MEKNKRKKPVKPLVKSLYNVVEEASIRYVIDMWGDKIKRNDLCPCLSGKKYKACHMKQIEEYKDWLIKENA